MTVIDREQLVARLLAGHYLEEVGAGNIMVMLLDERVPHELFNEFVRLRFVEERRRGWWAISHQGRKHLKRRPPDESPR